MSDAKPYFMEIGTNHMGEVFVLRGSGPNGRYVPESFLDEARAEVERLRGICLDAWRCYGVVLSEWRDKDTREGLPPERWFPGGIRLADLRAARRALARLEDAGFDAPPPGRGKGGGVMDATPYSDEEMDMLRRFPDGVFDEPGAVVVYSNNRRWLATVDALRDEVEGLILERDALHEEATREVEELRGVLKAWRVAEKASDAYEELWERAYAEGWQTDATGYGHLASAEDRAARLMKAAMDARDAALGSEGKEE